jgi:hypothetical protein
MVGCGGVYACFKWAMVLAINASAPLSTNSQSPGICKYGNEFKLIETLPNA